MQGRPGWTPAGAGGHAARTGAISAHADGRTTVIRLSGEVDASLRADASRALATALTAGGPVVLDLREVTFIDSTGLAFVIQCHRACGQSDQECVLRDVPEDVAAMLALLGVDWLTAAGSGRPPPPAPRGAAH
ncbi:STAS domain-containing protein [Cellulomonas sp. C5510]|uniref:STAS domain-containing protein n=1 Tax=Cellulomonas sp. C5510 TaxID=2871170 RepID=UPI001C98D40A|nr:STAS domain-containing protein [Cellulomonas sp. C5510]QZN84195.1 STAS domain-containing protein [Cellulomonas sp. C5510]